MIKNIKQAKELVKLYNSITIYRIKEGMRSLVLPDISVLVAEHLTGFGSMACCSLCQSAGYVNGDIDCDSCIYQGYLNCHNGVNAITYRAIMNANTPKELKSAYKARAKHIQSIITKLESHI